MQVCAIARARATIGGPMRESRTPCNAATFHCSTTLSLALAWPITPTGQIRTTTIIKDRNNKGSLDADVEDRCVLGAIGRFPPAVVDDLIDTNHLLSQRIDSATASRASVSLAVTVILARPSCEGRECIRQRRRCVRCR